MGIRVALEYYSDKVSYLCWGISISRIK